MALHSNLMALHPNLVVLHSNQSGGITFESRGIPFESRGLTFESCGLTFTFPGFLSTDMSWPDIWKATDGRPRAQMEGHDWSTRAGAKLPSGR